MARIIAGLIAFALVSGPSPRAAERPGVAPEDPWTCPATHPIKGYVSHESGRRVYFLPGGRFYEEASPERCYATEDEARRDGSRPARDPRPLPPFGDIVSRPVSGPLSRGEDRRERGAEAEAPPYRGPAGLPLSPCTVRATPSTVLQGERAVNLLVEIRSLLRVNGDKADEIVHRWRNREREKHQLVL